MIINNFLGGLGNQLFQIAAGFSHASLIGSDFAINYDLGIGFGQGHNPKRYKNNIYSRIPETKRNQFVPYEEPGFSFSPIPMVDDLCLVGYYQSEKYFSNFKDEIKNLITFPKDTKKKINEKMRFSSKKKIGIHIRLGDYNHENNRGVFADIDVKNYISNAMNFFNDDDVDFLIFSDDFVSLKSQFDVSIFKNLHNSDEIEDLYSLSQCDGVIISNSSFSWWGAWLGKKKYKVITPNRWFGPKGPKNYQDIYKKDWIKI